MSFIEKLTAFKPPLQQAEQVRVQAGVEAPTANAVGHSRRKVCQQVQPRVFAAMAARVGAEGPAQLAALERGAVAGLALLGDVVGVVPSAATGVSVVGVVVSTAAVAF